MAKEVTVAGMQAAFAQREARDGELEREIQDLEERIGRAVVSDADPKKLYDQRDARVAERKKVREEMGILQEALQEARAREAADRRETDAARADTLATVVAAEIAGLAQDLREALAPSVARLQRAEKVHQELQDLWRALDRGEFLGGQALARLRYLVDQLLAGARAMEGGTR